MGLNSHCSLGMIVMESRFSIRGDPSQPPSQATCLIWGERDRMCLPLVAQHTQNAALSQSGATLSVALEKRTVLLELDSTSDAERLRNGVVHKTAFFGWVAVQALLMLSPTFRHETKAYR